MWKIFLQCFDKKFLEFLVHLEMDWLIQEEKPRSLFLNSENFTFWNILVISL